MLLGARREGMEERFVVDWSCIHGWFGKPGLIASRRTEVVVMAETWDVGLGGDDEDRLGVRVGNSGFFCNKRPAISILGFYKHFYET